MVVSILHGFAEKCVIYLVLFNVLEPGQDISNDAFLNYSAEHWGFHYREAEVADDVPIVLPALEICNPDSVDINAKDEDGRTPLSWAEKNGHNIIVQLLQA
ncbi:hypothetical protein BJ170DRAFT_690115 [Xylariales sp. AK1849]|nr:hypothetical protein BJ170DRAFT_690115 [Xylariales sp. AK1849]